MSSGEVNDCATGIYRSQQTGAALGHHRGHSTGTVSRGIRQVSAHVMGEVREDVDSYQQAPLEVTATKQSLELPSRRVRKGICRKCTGNCCKCFRPCDV